INSEKGKLIHNIELNYLSPKAARWKIHVDASSGEIIKKQKLIKHATAEGSGTGVNGDKKSPLYLSNDNGQYSLNDTSNDTRRETQTAHGTTAQRSRNAHESSAADKAMRRAALDRHFYANGAYDYH